MAVLRLRIGEVAKQADVNIQTLRYYERCGVLEKPERTTSGYRSYPAETVRLIRFIKRAQSLGFTLSEIEGLITLREARGRRRSEIRSLAEAKICDIDRKLNQLQAMRDALQTLVESCACRDGRLACPILEALDEAEGAVANDPLVPKRGDARP